MNRSSGPFIEAIEAMGHSIEELRPAFPGRSLEQIRQILIDSAACLERPVINYGLLGLSPQATGTFKVAENGYRLNGSASKWPPDPNMINIFFFGGSTGLGLGVADEDTIPANLERMLQQDIKNCRIYNFSYGSYTSRQEFLRLLDLVDGGFVPHIAVFLDGLNDTHYAFGNHVLTSTLNKLYLEEKVRRRLPYLSAVCNYAMSLRRHRNLRGVADYHPQEFQAECAAVTSDNYIQRALERSDSPGSPQDLTAFHDIVANRVLNWYNTSRECISTLARTRGFEVLFAWQPIPYYATPPRQRLAERLLYLYRYHVLCEMSYRWLEARAFQPILDAGFATVNLAEAGRNINEPLYVDSCHYSPAFCQEIAGLIAERMKNSQLMLKKEL